MRALRTLLVVGLVITLVTPVSAAPGDEMWVATFDDGGDIGGARAISVSPDGSRVFVTGDVEFPTSTSSTLAYDAETGAELWQAAPLPYGVEFEAVAVSPDSGTVYVAGASGIVPENGASFQVIAYDAASGAELWEAHYDSEQDCVCLDEINDIAVSGDGSRLFVTGISFELSTDFNYLTLAYDAATGQRLWVARYNGDSSGLGDHAKAIGVSPDGASVYVTGWAHIKRQKENAVTIAYRASDGKQRWRAQYDDRGGHQRGEDLVVSPAGNLVCIAGVNHASSTKFMTVCYRTATGKQAWARGYLRGYAAFGTALTFSAGRVFVTGFTFSNNTPFSGDVVAYRASDGKPLWSDAPAALHHSNDIDLNPVTGEILVAGYGFESGSGSEAVVIAFDPATGQETWKGKYDSPRAETFKAIAPALDGSAVFATGGVEAASDEDYLTVAFSTT